MVGEKDNTMDSFSGWLIKNLNWIVPTCITTHAGVLAHLLTRIDSKVDRTEFENRVSSVESQLSKINDIIVDISRQNGEIQATLIALKESSINGDRHVMDLLDLLK